MDSMVGSVGGPQFHQPAPFDSERELAISNTKHAADTLTSGLEEIKEGLENKSPSLIISESKNIEHSASIIGKNLSALTFDTEEAWKQIEPDLQLLKDQSNSGSAEINETIDRINDSLKNFRSTL
jgi:hypothetical protein